MNSLVNYGSSDDDSEICPNLSGNNNNHAGIQLTKLTQPLFASLPTATTHHIAAPSIDTIDIMNHRPHKKRRHKPRDAAASGVTADHHDNATQSDRLVLPPPKHHRHNYSPPPYTIDNDSKLNVPVKTPVEQQIDELVDHEHSKDDVIVDGDNGKVQIDYNLFVDSDNTTNNQGTNLINHQHSAPGAPGHTDNADHNNEDGLPPGIAITVLPATNHSTQSYNTDQSQTAATKHQWRRYIGRDISPDQIIHVQNTDLAQRNAHDQRLYEYEQSLKTSHNNSITTKLYNTHTGTDSVVNVQNTNINKSKHHIGELAAQSAALEIENERNRVLGLQHKKQTRNKYGW